MNKVKIGVIGAGWWATENHIPHLAERDEVELTSVCKLEEDQLSFVKNKFNFKHASTDFKEMLDLSYLDGVVISSPHHAHYENAKAALEKNCHVMIEKPMTTVSREAETLLQLAKKKNKHILIPNGFNFKNFMSKAEEIIIDKKSPFLRSVIVNRGSKDNVILGMAVLDEKFLVGKVVEVNYSTSRVLLLSDLNSKIPVSIEPNGVQSILSGSGSNFGEIQYIKEDYQLDSDFEIFTSGSGGIFRSGIPIGKMNISSNGIVNFFSDFTQLSYVKIVSYKSGGEE